MHFSYVEIGDNFVPDIVADQFRRKPVKFGVTLNEGDNMGEAINQIHEAIKEYIEKNTVYHSPNILDGLPPEPTVLPSIQNGPLPEMSLIEQMDTCTDVEVLKSYRLLAKKGIEEQSFYHFKLKQLQP